MRRVLLDGNHITSRELLHDTLARQLALPDYYGKNWDALFDCLTDLHEPTEIVLVNAAALEAQLGKQCAAFIRVLRDASRENAALSFLCIFEDAPGLADEIYAAQGVAPEDGFF